MPEIVRRFWGWYERYYALNAGVAAVLFLWQLLHLYWLGAHVIALRLTGISYFPVSGFWQMFLILVDYTEIPAIISTSLLYLFELRRFSTVSIGKRLRLLGLLILLNSQWLHLFWITDEFVIHTFLGQAHGGSVLPLWLAWVAILIDYLELPVILDITWRFVNATRRGVTARTLRDIFQ